MGIKHEIHHGLEPALARRAIDKAMDGYRERFSEFSPTYDWTSEDAGRFAFTALTVTVSGDLEIVGPKILVDIQVPFLLRAFKGRAIQAIDDEVRGWVEKARAGELD